MASGHITSWEIDGETVETVSDFIFFGGARGGALVRIKLSQQDLIPLVLSQETLTPHWMLCIFMLYLDEGERRE